MERRADAGSGLEESAAWQAVRRTLGRLFSRVGVRTVEEAERAMTVPIKPSALASPPQISRGDGWKPTAAPRLAPVPAAGTGLRESDLLPRVTLAHGDYALHPPAIAALPSAASSARVESAEVSWTADVTALPDEFLRLLSAPVRVIKAALLDSPKTGSLRGWAMAQPPVKALRLPRTDSPRTDSPRTDSPRTDTPRVRWGGDSVLRRMPLTRQSRPIGSDLVARRRLAETAHLGTDDITLLGVYPDVPILAVERIVVEDEGRRLKLWLKPEILRGRSGSHKITLLVGRQTATGKMLQGAL